MSEVAFFILFCVAFVVGLAALVAWAIWEEVQERRAQRDKRQHLMNEAIHFDIKARDRKHNTMREMRRIAREYRR